jgi:hypothetical protein
VVCEHVPHHFHFEEYMYIGISYMQLINTVTVVIVRTCMLHACMCANGVIHVV